MTASKYLGTNIAIFDKVLQSIFRPLSAERSREAVPHAVRLNFSDASGAACRVAFLMCNFLPPLRSAEGYGVEADLAKPKTRRACGGRKRKARGEGAAAAEADA